jgi:hypothetical protein
MESQMKLNHFTSDQYLTPSILDNRLKLSTFHNLDDQYGVMSVSYDD